MTVADFPVASENGKIHSFPRLLLNARRTKDKPTAEEQEEWLVQYDPVLPDDTRRVLSHNYHVCYMSLLIFRRPCDLTSLLLPFELPDREYKTHSNCAVTVGVHINRLCIWSRSILHTCDALWYI